MCLRWRVIVWKSVKAKVFDLQISFFARAMAQNAPRWWWWRMRVSNHSIWLNFFLFFKLIDSGFSVNFAHVHNEAKILILNVGAENLCDLQNGFCIVQGLNQSRTQLHVLSGAALNSCFGYGVWRPDGCSFNSCGSLIIISVWHKRVCAQMTRNQNILLEDTLVT